MNECMYVFEGKTPAFLWMFPQTNPFILLMLALLLWRYLLHLHGSQWIEQKQNLYSGDSEVCSKPRQNYTCPVLVPHEGGTWTIKGEMRDLHQKTSGTQNRMNRSYVCMYIYIYINNIYIYYYIYIIIYIL